MISEYQTLNNAVRKGKKASDLYEKMLKYWNITIWQHSYKASLTFNIYLNIYVVSFTILLGCSLY